jgi:hypothetical protein
MFRSALVGLFGGAVSLLVACSGAGGGAVGESGQEVDFAPPLPGSTCPTDGAVWVAPAGVTPGAVDGKGGTWSASPLFATGAPGLAAYWSFTWASAASVPADFGALGSYVAALGGAPVQRDCPAVTALGSSVTDQVWTTMRNENAQRTSRLGTLPSASGLTSVRVAVVDSAAQAYTSGTNDTSDHGRTVGRAIRELSCPAEFAGTLISPSPLIAEPLLAGPIVNPVVGPSSPCVGQVSNFPALVQLTPTTTDTTLGGYFGTESELAGAIARAVDSWLGEPAATRPPHLVVNLSVGWDSGQGYGGEYVDVPSTLPPAARAVQAAITHAVCHGALVVAAAGNQSSPGSSGPMFPAAWESHAGPTTRDCTVFEGAATLPADPATVTYRPLVHAVGGLDAADAPLSNTRPLGRPRLAAYGEDVVTVDPRAVHTDMLSGTSMAAANVSGIASAVWGYLPAATANQVMQLVYDSSVTLANDTADFGVGTARETIHRAALCDSVKAATGGTFACNTPAAYTGAPPALAFTTLDLGFAATPVAAALVAAPSLPTTAGLSQPWVTSQPGSPSCTTCQTHGAMYYVGTNPAPSPYSASAGVITRKTSTSGGPVTEYFQFAPPTSSATNFANYAVAIPTTGVTGTVTSVTVTWGVTGGATAYQTTAPLAVGP